jgi:hypothetical protein
MFGTWMKLALNTSMLALEAQQVIGLRLMKLTLGGPVATREANRMVAEKVIAFGEAAANVATGSTTRSVVKDYRKKVRESPTIDQMMNALREPEGFQGSPRSKEGL